MLARAIVDIALHQRTMTFDEAVAFYVDSVGMMPTDGRTRRGREELDVPVHGAHVLAGHAGDSSTCAARCSARGPAFRSGVPRRASRLRLHSGAADRAADDGSAVTRCLAPQCAVRSSAIVALARSLCWRVLLAPAERRGAVERPAHRRLRPRARHHEPLRTHILEDIQSCVIEGLTITDENMNIVPVLAAEVPTLENGGVGCAPMAAWTSPGSCVRA